eukprot:COSAG02_NODE_2942_length_7692_cov_3.853154_3_plen_165_part_00
MTGMSSIDSSTIHVPILHEKCGSPPGSTCTVGKFLSPWAVRLSPIEVTPLGRLGPAAKIVNCNRDGDRRRHVEGPTRDYVRAPYVYRIACHHPLYYSWYAAATPSSDGLLIPFVWTVCGAKIEHGMRARAPDTGDTARHACVLISLLSMRVQRYRFQPSLYAQS